MVCLADTLLSPEHIHEELNQMLCLVNHDTGRRGVPALGGEVFTVRSSRIFWERGALMSPSY
jgi:hypothetical protein